MAIKNILTDLNIDGTVTGTGGLLAGISDTEFGHLTLYGQATGSASGGQATFHTAADYDTTIDYWRARASGEGFIINGSTSNTGNLQLAAASAQLGSPSSDAWVLVTDTSVAIKNTLNLDTSVNAGLDTDKFLVLDGTGNVDFRTGAELLSDIGGIGGSIINNQIAVGAATANNIEGDIPFTYDSATGNMGLGVAVPDGNYARILHIHNASSAGASIHLTDNVTGVGSTNGTEILHHTNDAYWINRDPGRFVFFTNGLERGAFDANGNFYAAGHINATSTHTFQINDVQVLSATALATAVQVGVNSLNSGTAATGTTYWTGDGTWTVPTLDGFTSGQFLRSDAADTKSTGTLTFADDVKLQIGTTSTGTEGRIKIQGGASATSLIDLGCTTLQFRDQGAANVVRFSFGVSTGDLTMSTGDIALTAGGITTNASSTLNATVSLNATMLVSDNNRIDFGTGNDYRTQFLSGSLLMEHKTYNSTNIRWTDQTSGTIMNMLNTGEVMIGDNAAHIGDGTTAVFSVHQEDALGAVLGDTQLITSTSTPGGTGGNEVYVKEYGIRNAANNDWTSFNWHTCSDVDNSFDTPGVDTKCFWERDLQSGHHYFGNAANYTFIIDASNERVGIGIGKTAPSSILHINEDATTGTGIIYTGGGSDGNMAQFSRDIGATGTHIKIHANSNYPTVTFEDATNSWSTGNRAGVYHISRSTSILSTSAFMIDSADNVGVGINAAAKFHVYQSDTNTGAAAGITIEQGSTGDSKLGFSLTAGEQWSIGIDNSDGDSFKISNSNDLSSDYAVIIGAGTNHPMEYTDGGRKIVTDDGSSSHTVLAADRAVIRRFTGSSAITVTVDTGSLERVGETAEIDQNGTGLVTIAAGTATLRVNAAASLVSSGQYSRISIQKMTSTDYRIFGELA